MTQDLMKDEGVNIAREEYYKDNLPEVKSYGYRYTPINYVAEGAELFLPTSWGGDRTGFVLGSYNVTITNNGDGTATFVVNNTTGWASATKNPFYFGSDLFGIPRSEHSVQGLLSGEQDFTFPSDFFLASILDDRLRSDTCWYGRFCLGGTVNEEYYWIEPLLQEKQDE